MNTVPNFDVMMESHKIAIQYPRGHNPRSIKCLFETPIVKTPLYFPLFFHYFLFIYRGSMKVVHGLGPDGDPWTGGQCYVYTPQRDFLEN